MTERKTSPELWVVMPAYNERQTVASTVSEWLPVLRNTCANFVLCVLNDGSRDDTLAVLQALRRDVPELVTVDKPNTGHGQTCIWGYRLAVQADARWVFQLDSDGQCEPGFFPQLWRARQQSDAVYGFRRRRDDGLGRLLVSRLVSAVAWLAFGVWVRDANVPYRLMTREAVVAVIEQVPSDFVLANVLVAVLQQERFGIRWLDIGFRKRVGGEPSVKALAFAARGFQMYRQLREVKRARGS